MSASVNMFEVHQVHHDSVDKTIHNMTSQSDRYKLIRQNSDYLQFYDAWKGLSDWLEDGEKKLKKYAQAQPGKVKQDIDELKVS